MSQTRFQKAERMADIMAVIIEKKDKCLDSDLIEIGFTAETVSDLRPLAEGLFSVSKIVPKPTQH